MHHRSRPQSTLLPFWVTTIYPVLVVAASIGALTGSVSQSCLECVPLFLTARARSIEPAAPYLRNRKTPSPSNGKLRAGLDAVIILTWQYARWAVFVGGPECAEFLGGYECVTVPYGTESMASLVGGQRTIGWLTFAEQQAYQVMKHENRHIRLGPKHVHYSCVQT